MLRRSIWKDTVCSIGLSSAAGTAGECDHNQKKRQEKKGIIGVEENT
jgi:hypothetical protein